MDMRIIRCKCSHKLRFGTSTCSYCFRATPLRNRYWFWALLAAGVAAAYGVAIEF